MIITIELDESPSKSYDIIECAKKWCKYFFEDKNDYGKNKYLIITDPINRVVHLKSQPILGFGTPKILKVSSHDREIRMIFNEFSFEYGYKGFHKTNDELHCLGYIFESDKTAHIHRDTIRICSSGFHYCKKLEDVFQFYDKTGTNTVVYHKVLCKDTRTSQSTKSVTNVLIIGEEITQEQYFYTRYKDKLDLINEIQEQIKAPVIIGGSLALQYYNALNRAAVGDLDLNTHDIKLFDRFKEVEDPSKGRLEINEGWSFGEKKNDLLNKLSKKDNNQPCSDGKGDGNQRKMGFRYKNIKIDVFEVGATDDFETVVINNKEYRFYPVEKIMAAKAKYFYKNPKSQEKHGIDLAFWFLQQSNKQSK